MPVTPDILNPIGVFNCQPNKKYDVPRQAVLNPKQGTIKLKPHSNFEQALQDLSCFSHIWLVYLFDNNTWKPKVQTPRLLEKKGVFSTRSPYRPNPIGLSLVELVNINKLNIEILNYDLLDQTKILDIKPYISYCDSVATPSNGWLNNVEKFELSYSDNFYKKLLFYFPEKPTELINFINQQLSYAPINHPNKRVKVSNGKNTEYILSYKYYRIGFSIKDKNIYIQGLNKEN